MSDDHNYAGFDELDRLPELNRRNYEFELGYFRDHLPKCASVLQVGSMDGIRILRFLSARPDLRFTGLEIDRELVSLARENICRAGRSAEFVVADVVALPADLGPFDYVLCLNNTLGFIEAYDVAIERMSSLGRTYVSVYGEAFDNERAQEYYGRVGFTIDKFDGDVIYVRGIGKVRRFPRAVVEMWGSVVSETPLGYLVLVGSLSE